MHEFKTDRAKNRLYLTLRGFSSLEVIQDAVRELKAAVGELKPGFDVVTDISDYKTARPEIAQEIQQIALFLKQSGMRRVVRVVSVNNVVARMQFERTSRPAGYEAEVVTSVDEADALLDR